MRQIFTDCKTPHLHDVQSLGRTLMLRSDICQRWVSSRGYAIQPIELVYALLGCSHGLVEITASLLIAGVSHLPKYE